MAVDTRDHGAIYYGVSLSQPERGVLCAHLDNSAT
jgi:hypothetical protein